MSALPPKADIGTQPRDVRFVPKADIARLEATVPAILIAPRIVVFGLSRVTASFIVFVRGWLGESDACFKRRASYCCVG